MPNLLAKLFKKDSKPSTPKEADNGIADVVPISRKAKMSGIGEMPNLSVSTDVDRIQSAIRSAERGNTLLLFTLYRDMIMGFSHLQAEWAKRKMVVTGQPQAVIPHTESAEDAIAAKVIRQMIEKCDNWMDGLSHLLEAGLYPVALAEKIFRQPRSDDNLQIPVRWLLKEICPINYLLLNFQASYVNPEQYRGNYDSNGDVNDYESDLLIYSTKQNGAIDFSTARSYRPDPDRHIVHRGNFLSRAIRDNFGGQMRAILFWWLLATKGRDWWALFMQKYGSPFIVGKADTQQSDTVRMLQNAFQLASQIGGIVVDKRAEVELHQAAATDGANAHKILKDACNEEVSKIVVGQVLSSTAKNTGLGSGMADFHGEVRDDIRRYDTSKLSETLTKQLFSYYLRINGIPGNPPSLEWGGMRAGDASAQADVLSKLKLAALEPTDEGLQVMSKRFGFGLQRAPEPVVKPSGNPKDN